MWFAIIDGNDNIVSNHFGGRMSLPDGLLMVPSNLPAPNPQDHMIDRVNGTPVVVQREKPLEEIKEIAKGEVDKIAGLVRSAYITTTPGQAEVYQEKLAEAREARARLDAGESVTAADYPFLQAEMTVTGADLSATADNILAIAAQWRTVGASIEQARRAGKVAIDAAIDKTGVEQAKESAAATLRGMANGAT